MTGATTATVGASVEDALRQHRISPYRARRITQALVADGLIRTVATDVAAAQQSLQVLVPLLAKDADRRAAAAATDARDLAYTRLEMRTHSRSLEARRDS